jgi:hypothetical protein
VGWALESVEFRDFGLLKKTSRGPIENRRQTYHIQRRGFLNFLTFKVCKKFTLKNRKYIDLQKSSFLCLFEKRAKVAKKIKVWGK